MRSLGPGQEPGLASEGSRPALFPAGGNRPAGTEQGWRPD